MPKENKRKICVDDLRHAEYYDMQKTFDELYAKSKDGEVFTDLMQIILKRENILLAYRNMKTNMGSRTAGTDKLTIADIGRLSPETVVEKVKYILCGSSHGYRPKPVRRKDIPKQYDPTKTRPLGIPCIWDRLIQQCIKQVLEPICEAQFSDNSYGFRPNRSVENAISKVYNLMQLSHLHYVIEFDIKGFFDNVNHSKLIKQIWTMGIRDKQLIYIIRQVLKAKIKMPDGSYITPQKGTPQGGIISPLLANIVLNELDRWIESQWQENPVTVKYQTIDKRNGKYLKSNGYRAMRTTKQKEMYIVRYADDFRIFCRNKQDCIKTKIAITKWLYERLHLEISEEKTRIVNIKRRYSDFLGFKIGLYQKGIYNKKTKKTSMKWVVKSHMSDQQLQRQRRKFVEQAKRIDIPSKYKSEFEEIRLYNSMVLGVQNYYSIATNINADCALLNRAVMTVFTNRLEKRLRKEGRPLRKSEIEKFGQSKMMRYTVETNEPIYPIGYTQHKNPMAFNSEVCAYTEKGRSFIHDNLKIDTLLMIKLMKSSCFNCSIEFSDNRISLFSAQYGKCAITGKKFLHTADIHCHHKIPKEIGGTDEYKNLILVTELVHKLIHATRKDLLLSLISTLNLTTNQMENVNSLRRMAKLPIIADML